VQAKDFKVKFKLKRRKILRFCNFGKFGVRNSADVSSAHCDVSMLDDNLMQRFEIFLRPFLSIPKSDKLNTSLLQ